MPKSVTWRFCLFAPKSTVEEALTSVAVVIRFSGHLSGAKTKLRVSGESRSNVMAPEHDVVGDHKVLLLGACLFFSGVFLILC